MYRKYSQHKHKNAQAMTFKKYEKMTSAFKALNKIYLQENTSQLLARKNAF